MREELLKSDTCIFCGTSDLEILIPREVLPDEVNVLKCPKCDLVFLQSRTTDDELDPEETVYWDRLEQKKIYLGDRIQKLFVREFEERLSQLEKFVPRRSTTGHGGSAMHFGGGKLLDVGSGVGHFLATAQKRGWSVQGLDISHAAQKAARQTYDLDVKVGTLDGIDISALGRGSFDAVTLWDVIEHIRQPIENLKVVNQLLRMNGVVTIKTPNETGFFKQIALALYRFLGRRAAFLLKYVYYVPHYYSYSKKTMDFLLKRCGFEAIRYEIDETPYEFASEKINVHYKSDPRRSMVIAILPFASFLGRLFRKGNKMIVYARKVREVNGR